MTIEVKHTFGEHLIYWNGNALSKVVVVEIVIEPREKGYAVFYVVRDEGVFAKRWKNNVSERMLFKTKEELFNTID